MATNPRGCDESTVPDQLAGVYRAAWVPSEDRGYPIETELVVVHPEGPDGYHDVEFQDGYENVVARNNRAKHRIKAALSGGRGYDVILKVE